MTLRLYLTNKYPLNCTAHFIHSEPLLLLLHPF